MEEIVKEKIEKYQRLADLAYERGWFDMQEQYLLIINAFTELLEEL